MIFGLTPICLNSEFYLLVPHTVDGTLKSGVHQLRLVVYPIVYRALAPSQVVQDFFHQQYDPICIYLRYTFKILRTLQMELFLYRGIHLPVEKSQVFSFQPSCFPIENVQFEM